MGLSIAISAKGMYRAPKEARDRTDVSREIFRSRAIRFVHGREPAGTHAPRLRESEPLIPPPRRCGESQRRDVLTGRINGIVAIYRATLNAPFAEFHALASGAGFREEHVQGGRGGCHAAFGLLPRGMRCQAHGRGLRAAPLRPSAGAASAIAILLQLSVCHVKHACAQLVSVFLITLLHQCSATVTNTKAIQENRKNRMFHVKQSLVLQRADTAQRGLPIRDCTHVAGSYVTTGALRKCAQS